MKKHLSFILTIFPIFFFACNDFSDLAVPESVSVKQNANYNLSMGGSAFDIAEKVDVTQLKKALTPPDDGTGEQSTKSDLTVYDYNPTYDPANPETSLEQSKSDVLQYILNYQIQGISLGLTTDPKLNKIPFNTTFKAPDFSSTIATNLTVNTTLPVTEPGASVPFSTNNINFTITSPKFSKMHIRNGTLDITFTKPENVSDNFSMTISISITDTNGNVLAGPSEEKNLAQGGKVSIPLAGKTLVQNMKFAVKGTISGGTLTTPPKELSYGVTSTPNGIAFDTIEGLTMTTEELGENATLQIQEEFELNGINNALKSAVIEEGKLNFSCTYPDGWSGIVVDEQYFVLTGGIGIGDDKFVKQKRDGYIIYDEADLAGLPVEPKPVHTYDTTAGTKSYIKFHLENATIKFADTNAGKTDEIILAGECNITKIRDLRIDISALASLGTGENKEIDTGISFNSLLSNMLEKDDTDVNNLLKNFEFCDIDGYLLMTYPEKCSEKLEDIGFSASVEAIYDQGYQDLITSGTTLKMKKSDKTLPGYKYSEPKKDKDGKDVKDDDGNIVYKEWIGKDGAAFIAEKNSAKLEHIADVINEYPDNLKISYELNVDKALEDITLTGDDIEALTDSSSSINISLILIVPLKIKIYDKYDYPSTIKQEDGFITIFDVLKIADKELTEDLLKRDSANEESKTQKYVNLIQNITLSYNIKNNTGLDFDAYFYDDKVFNSTIFEPKKLEVDAGDNEVVFSREEIQKIISSESYPFEPKIKLVIPQSKLDDQGLPIPIIITRDANFGINASLSVQTDGTVEVWNKND